ncbi:E3 ubiquitin-protein ligase TRIM7-like [Diretmus argenteus]
MAEKTALVERFLNCHVCSETFTNPVSLSCHHSFCSSCLKRFWEGAKNKNCPVCKRKSLKDERYVNFPLKELADSFAGRRRAESSEAGKGEEEVEGVCSKHPEGTKWFCKDEERAVCPVCEFPDHHGHKVVPIEEAVSDLKEQLKSDLDSLQDKRNKHKEVEETYNEVVEHSKKQLVATEKQIRAEFNKLHQFLKEEEEARLEALREEEEQKGKTISREMKIIQEKISSFSDSISAVEEDLQKHNVSFLTSYKATQTSARAQCSLSDPQLVSGALIDVAKHLGNLSFRVWEKMKEKVQFSPVILDPNTADPRLCLSDDLTSVRREDTEQQLPDNPERNTKYPTVLGSEGFSSGKHSWEVEVGDHPRWIVGLAKESVDRKGERYFTPKHGIWCLLQHSGKYTNGLNQTVTVKKSLQRIRVQLDYKRGEVSFLNPEDKTLIYTYRDTFTEKLVPCFGVGPADDAKTTDIKFDEYEYEYEFDEYEYEFDEYEFEYEYEFDEYEYEFDEYEYEFDEYEFEYEYEFDEYEYEYEFDEYEYEFDEYEFEYEYEFDEFEYEYEFDEYEFEYEYEFDEFEYEYEFDEYEYEFDEYEYEFDEYEYEFEYEFV